LIQAMMSGKPLLEFLSYCIHVIVILLLLAMGAYFGQEVTDHYDHIFLSVYNMQWYAAPLHIQKTVLFLLQGGIKSFQMAIGGVFVASMETAATLVSTSISYCTVLYSTWQNS
ncbi:hypothetical protein HN011_000066, partial [Eciton burchellii]